MAEPGDMTPPLKAEEDFDRLTFPVYHYDDRATDELFSRTAEVLQGIMGVRVSGSLPLSATLCTYACDLRGFEQLMWDMVDRPHLVHRLMKHLMEGVLRVHSSIEQMDILTLNNTPPMYCSDDPRPDIKPGEVRLNDLWHSANSQEFDQVSLAMWEEFLLAYQIPILLKFWLTSYGCCENLTDKIQGVLKIPNLRIFVCSAWNDLERVVEAVGDKYTIVWCQKASDIVFSADLSDIRKHLEEGMRIAKDSYLQIVLRELQTVGPNAQRLHQWARIAREVAEQYS